MEWFCHAIAIALGAAALGSAIALLRRLLRRRRGEQPPPPHPRRWRRVLARTWRGAQWAALLAALLWLVLPAAWLVGLLAAPEAPGDIDALVVLGGGLTAGGELGVTTRERLDRAVQLGAGLYRVYVSGGPGTGPRMAAYLERAGLPPGTIVTEKSSYSTADNVARLCPELRRGGHGRVGVITSRFHSGRALALFAGRCPGLEFVARSAPQTQLFAEQGWLTVRTALLCEAAKRLHAAVF